MADSQELLSPQYRKESFLIFSYCGLGLACSEAGWDSVLNAGSTAGHGARVPRRLRGCGVRDRADASISCRLCAPPGKGVRVSKSGKFNQI